jgi:hypothetical protein
VNSGIYANEMKADSQQQKLNSLGAMRAVGFTRVDYKRSLDIVKEFIHNQQRTEN